MEDESMRVERSRLTFERAYSSMKSKGLKEEVRPPHNSQLLKLNCVPFLQRVILLEAWKEFETNHGAKETLARVEAKMPRVVKKRKKVDEEAPGETAAWEEYFDYIFPDDETQKSSFKLLALAQEWKKKQENVKRKRVAEDE
jgi:crooked neck